MEARAVLFAIGRVLHSLIEAWQWVGLNVASERRDVDEATHAVLLSGNGPLESVRCEVLTRDEVVRRRQRWERVRKGAAGESIKAFIQNVHLFRDEGLIDAGPPVEHVVIIDEAQHTWNPKQTAGFMLRWRAAGWEWSG